MIAALDADGLPYLVKRRLMKAFISFKVVRRRGGALELCLAGPAKLG